MSPLFYLQDTTALFAKYFVSKFYFLFIIFDLDNYYVS